jgi:hypothetical protein
MWSLHIHISPFRVPHVPATSIGQTAAKTRTKTEQNLPLPKNIFLLLCRFGRRDIRGLLRKNYAKKIVRKLTWIED